MMRAEDASSPELQTSRQPLRESVHRRHHVVPPAHHVVSKQATYLDYLPYVTASAPEVLYDTTRSSVFVGPYPSTNATENVQPSASAKESTRIGFRNPWPSWHKPELGEYWHGMHWVKSNNKDKKNLHDEYQGGVGDGFAGQSLQELLLSIRGTEGNQEQGLEIVPPDFRGVKKGIAQATWLGHATVLVQLPAIDPEQSIRPLRILFDPIFSMRCSPTQFFGPTRSFPAPCPVSALPEIDIVFISHSHYDHLDYDSIVQLWNAHKDYIRFLVPTGNREWFLNLGIGIEEDRVTELDWWDEAWFDQKSGDIDALHREHDMLRVICTPAQHGSGRLGIDASRSLWSSWTLEHISQGGIYRIFFGGDSGFQFHSSVPEASTYPTCPAFAEVAKHIGMPDLSFLPISIGASMNFVKSYDRLGVVPDLDEGLTAANHMTPHDAVRVAKILRGAEERESQESSGIIGRGKAVAIHWGTFVTGPDEVRKSINELQMACESHGVSYVRALDERQQQIDKDSASDLTFACLNHGQSVYLAMTGSASQ